MEKIKTFIINFNRLKWPVLMAEYLFQISELEVIFIDNNSNYPPLLEWYNKQNEFEIIKMDNNFGHNVVWLTDILKKYVQDYYIVTDPDLYLNNIPLDFLDVLKEGFDKYPESCKCGFSLDISDFKEPYTEYQKIILNREKNFWLSDKYDGKFYYKMAIDTTFALYNKSRYNNLSAVRTDKPYTAKHLPWYYSEDNLTEEDIYYIETSNSSCSTKKQMELFL
ncbi:MAG: hypothetical protein WC188_04465 [Candidatus Caldatribacteriota bacterium]|nr:hypothetical protein [Patescibacteria group bacterium]